MKSTSRDTEGAPEIYERLLRPRTYEGRRPEALDDLVAHCTRPFQLRSLSRDVLPVDDFRLERTRIRDDELPWHAPPRLARPATSARFAEVRPASRLARSAYLAVRAMRKALLRRPAQP